MTNEHAKSNAREGGGVAGLPPLPEAQKQVAVAGYHDGTLKDALEDYYDAEQMHAYAVAYHAAMQAQQGAEPVAWIPVDERLPEPGFYEVTVATDDGPEVLILQLNKKQQWIYEGEATFCHAFYIEVTHWRNRAAPATGAPR